MVGKPAPPQAHAPPPHRPVGWAGGATTDAKTGGILACDYHHDRIHAEKITITRNNDGDWEFYNRFGQHIGTSRPRSLGPLPHDPWNDAA